MFADRASQILSACGNLCTLTVGWRAQRPEMCKRCSDQTAIYHTVDANADSISNGPGSTWGRTQQLSV